jgi:hypothetical protein
MSLFLSLIDTIKAFMPTSTLTKPIRLNAFPSNEFVTTVMNDVPSLSPLPASNVLLSALQSDIDWNDPAQAFGAIVFLAYVGVSVAAGLKYVVKDGWRPKL